jgi:hypothetical protein
MPIWKMVSRNFLGQRKLGKASGKYDRWEKVSLGKGKILKNKILMKVIFKMAPSKMSN